jgi:hypothetical protein
MLLGCCRLFDEFEFAHVGRDPAAGDKIDPADAAGIDVADITFAPLVCHAVTDLDLGY